MTFLRDHLFLHDETTWIVSFSELVFFLFYVHAYLYNSLHNYGNELWQGSLLSGLLKPIFFLVFPPAACLGNNREM